MAMVPNKKEKKKLGLSKRPWWHWGLGITIILLLISGPVYYFYQKQQENKKYIFAINEKKYLRSDYNTEQAKPANSKIDSQKFKELYLSLKKKQYVAEKNDIKINQNLLDKRTAEFYYDKKNITYNQLDIIRQNVIYDLLFLPSARATSTGDYEGVIFVFPFARHITNYEGHLSTDPKGSNEIGIISAYDPTQIEIDKQYAVGRAKYYRDGIKKGLISPDKALSEIMADKKLSNVNSANESITFKNNGAQSWQDVMRIAGAIDYIKSLRPPVLSDIQIAKAEVMNNGQKSSVEAQYYFVNLTKAQPAKSNTDYNTLKNQIDDQIKQLKVIEYEKK